MQKSVGAGLYGAIVAAKKDFGNSKISLYQEIVNEWLQGSSRDNEKLFQKLNCSTGLKQLRFT